MSADGLRPETESAERWTTTGGIKSNIGVKQEGHVVSSHIQVSLINVNSKGESVEIIHLRPVGVMHDVAILSVADAADFLQPLPPGKFGH